jgi:hypothetical protein
MDALRKGKYFQLDPRVGPRKELQLGREVYTGLKGRTLFFVRQITELTLELEKLVFGT